MGFREENLDEDDAAGKYRVRPRKAYLIGGDEPFEPPVVTPPPKPKGSPIDHTKVPHCGSCGCLIEVRPRLDGLPAAYDPGTNRRHVCSNAKTVPTKAPPRPPSEGAQDSRPPSSAHLIDEVAEKPAQAKSGRLLIGAPPKPALTGENRTSESRFSRSVLIVLIVGALFAALLL